MYLDKIRDEFGLISLQIDGEQLFQHFLQPSHLISGSLHLSNSHLSMEVTIENRCQLIHVNLVIREYRVVARTVWFSSANGL